MPPTQQPPRRVHASATDDGEGRRKGRGVVGGTYHYNVLARRLRFNYATSDYGTERGWRVRAILQWLRLVRAEMINRARKRSNAWRTTEQNRLHQLYEQSRAPSLSMRTPQVYTWSAQEQISTTAAATSGAATVILKRSRGRTAAPAADIDTPTAQHPRQRRAVAPPPPEPTRERRVDGQLVFATNAHRLYVARITQWRWRPRTGDG